MSTRASTRRTIPRSSPTAPAPDPGTVAGPGASGVAHLSGAPIRLDHELLDAGEGRRLDRFGERLVDRPSPAATGLRRAQPRAWAAADLRWERGSGGDGAWSPVRAAAASWTIEAGPFRLELRATASGQVGCFPEHAEGWAWLAERARQAHRDGRPWRVLNLFAYTGGATLAAAAAGAAVTHVDAQRTAVAWARHNAVLSGLDDAPVRWIVDDAAAFVARELRRGRRYDAIVLDPPSYGHGAGDRVWRIAEGLPDLLRACVALAPPGGSLGLLLTCHSPGLGEAELTTLLQGAWPELDVRRLTARPLELPMHGGRRLAAGAAIRVDPR